MKRKLHFSGKLMNEIVNGKGFYIVLFICLLTVAVTGYVVTKNNMDTLAARMGDETSYDISADPQSDTIETVNAQQDTGKTETDVAKEQVVSDKAQKTTITATQTKTLYIKPVAGEVSMQFSMGDLIYSKTFSDWRTHSGIDIKGAVGTPVKATADGTVDDIYTDEMLGNVIVIDHGNNLKSIYANLSDSETVTKGQKIKRGDVIGGIGESAACESLEVPHLHFEIIKNGILQSPLEYIK